MKQINNLIKKTKSFIHGMLDVFKDRSSHDDVPFSVKALVGTFVKDFTPVTETKGLVFAGISNGDDVTVLGNHKLVKEIVNHLLANAIECTSMGYVVLNIEYVNGKLVIYVADSRIGMKMKYGDAEDLIHVLRGSIQVISDDGKGSKVIVHLPMSVYKG